MGLLSKSSKISTNSALQDEIRNILKFEGCYIDGEILYIQSNRPVVVNARMIRSIFCENGVLSGRIKEIHINTQVYMHIVQDHRFDPNIHIKVDESVCISGYGDGRNKIENINMACKSFWGDGVVDILSSKIECVCAHIPRGCIVDKTEIKYVI